MSTLAQFPNTHSHFLTVSCRLKLGAGLGFVFSSHRTTEGRRRGWLSKEERWADLQTKWWDEKREPGVRVRSIKGWGGSACSGSLFRRWHESLATCRLREVHFGSTSSSSGDVTEMRLKTKPHIFSFFFFKFVVGFTKNLKLENSQQVDWHNWQLMQHLTEINYLDCIPLNSTIWWSWFLVPFRNSGSFLSHKKKESFFV